MALIGLFEVWIVVRLVYQWCISATFGQITVKYCSDIHGQLKTNPADFGDMLFLFREVKLCLFCETSQPLLDNLVHLVKTFMLSIWRNSSTTMRLIFVFYLFVCCNIFQHLDAHVHTLLRVNCNHFSDLTFHLVPLSGQNLLLPNIALSVLCPHANMLNKGG